MIKKLAWLSLIVFTLAYFAKQLVLPYYFLPRDSKQDRHKEPAPATVVAEKLRVPWDIAFLPEGGMLVTERPGTLFYKDEQEEYRIPVASTLHGDESGLLGLALHPDFAINRQLFLYNTVAKNRQTFNRVERYRLVNGTLTEKKVILDDIPGAKYHDGGRMAFGPDGLLYITTGDATQEMLAQDTNSLAGKILRIHPDGTIPADNPFGNAVWSYGHRNPQGLSWDEQGNLWSTEHGPSGWESGHDELNRIEKGQNYGWPLVRGDEKAEGMTPPALHSGADATWAPASALYWDGSVFFCGLRGQALYEANITKTPIALKEHFKGRFGRLRALVLGPDGTFYLSTSNTDGRGFPQKGDDKVIAIDPKVFRIDNARR